MIFFLANGRLGNQIFQYVFLKTIREKNEQVIAAGFEDLREVFESDDFLLLNCKNMAVKGFFYGVVKPVFYFLSAVRIISSASVNYDKVPGSYRREGVSYQKRKGLLSFLIFVKPGFFQSEKFFDGTIAKSLKIREIFLSQADDFSKNLPQGTHKVFVHIRRGDYKDYMTYGKSTVLPISYYREQIDWFLKNKDSSYFIFFSDDPDFVEKEFHAVSCKAIPGGNHYGTDIAIMTKCDSGILSPSSFGWWGAYLMEKRDTVFAPEHWMGFNSGTDFQAQTVAGFMRKVKVVEKGKEDDGKA